ncbi:PqiB family protein [Tritonibacter horizontis]|uniref:Paraquat-inducible protein B n=1 Tax=Tritonibacter horizontis TaxID=1768241 RepID=A0A132BZM0_9RHOB|nr:MlaD family protein [Tritonibacter horizontis]KUP93277.1 paraquat-inducible protein B [Tritonibacter horizontis]
MPTDPPELKTLSARRPLYQRISLVWLVPLAAVVIAVALAAQNWAARGPLIELLFDEATGITEGSTELRYRDVTVGHVEAVEFEPGLERVVVKVRLNQDIADYVDRDAVFWVVKPEVTTTGVSGLNTVLSGVYIAGVWDADPGGVVLRHEGQTKAPLLPAGDSGLLLTLEAAAGVALTANAPITYKGLEVGRVGTPELSADRQSAIAPAVIFAPYDQLVRSTTRFWDTSGFSFSLGASGAELDFSSLSSLIAGGVSFDTVISGGTPVSDDAPFQVFASQSDARQNVFDAGRGNGVPFSIIFEDNVSGLEVDAPVEVRGLKIGVVTGITGIVDEARFNDSKVRLQISVELNPAELRLASPNAADQAVEEFMAKRVQSGLRARLVSTGLFATGLKVELIDVADAPEAELVRDHDPYPLIPVTESVISDAGASAEGMLSRLGELPIEELMQSAVRFLDTATGLAANTTMLVQDDTVRAIPADVRALLGDVRGVVGSAEIQGLPGQTAQLLTDLNSTVTDLRDLIAQVEEARAIEKLVQTVEAAGDVAASAEASLAGMPGLIESLTETAETARALPLDKLVARVSDVVADVETLLEQPGTRAIPQTLNDTLNEMRLALSELREGGTVAALNDTMASARSAATAIEEATVDLPQISARIDALLKQAAATLAGYDQGSEINRTARSAMTALTRAAAAVESLARALERRPNSLILGR